MIILRTVSLLNGHADLAPVISHQQVTEQTTAQDLLQQARTQAEKIIREAEAQANQIQKQTAESASEQFWQQAAHFFAQQQQQQQQLIETLDHVVSEALSQLLAELPPSEKIQSLLHQLLKASHPSVTGRLLCHPKTEAAVRDWLQQHPAINWKLIPDDSLPIDGVQLSTDHGDLLLNWTQATQILINPQ